ncbi:MAG: cell division protein FtsA [Prevotellaceae bacterium]|jgi:cell division protein FtsA|nr:cell division protein FtsA [Prevotellaceae bacterium]
MTNYIAAIDLGTTKIVTVIGEKKDNHFRIVAYAEAPSSGIKGGEVENIKRVADAVTPTLEKVKQEAGIEKIDEVFVGIAGQYIRCIESSTDLTRDNYEKEIDEEEIMRLEKDMKKMRVEPGEIILHVIPQTYNVDNAMGVNDPVGRLGNKLSCNFHIIIGKSASTLHTSRCIERLDMKLKHLFLEPIASARAILTDDEKELGVAMIDMGGGSTDLLIYHDNIVRHTAVIPWGGKTITGDIQKICAIPQRDAERIKVTYGTCMESFAQSNKEIIVPIEQHLPRQIEHKLLAKIIEARMKEIIGFVMHEIARSGYARKLGAGIVFTGGAADTKNLAEFIHLNTGMSFRIGRPGNNLAGSQDVIYPKYSTAIGLIMCGFDYIAGKKDDEYFNPNFAGSEKLRSKETILDNKPVETPPVPPEPPAQSWMDKQIAKVIKHIKDIRHSRLHEKV